MIRYGVVAAIAFIIDFGLLFVFTNYLHIFYLLSATLSFSISLIVNYYLSTSWVFSDTTRRAKHIQITLFILIGVSGLALNTAVIGFCTSALGIYYLYSKLIATAIVFFWSFFSRRYLMTGKRAATVADKW
jgi:putative flippase GtrA